MRARAAPAECEGVFSHMSIIISGTLVGRLVSRVFVKVAGFSVKILEFNHGYAKAPHQKS